MNLQQDVEARAHFSSGTLRMNLRCALIVDGSGSEPVCFSSKNGAFGVGELHVEVAAAPAHTGRSEPTTIVLARAHCTNRKKMMLCHQELNCSILQQALS
jgi:hypothetical protein